MRTTDGSTLPLQALQAAVSAVDASLPAYRVQRLSDAVRRQTSSQRFASAVPSMFSLGALLLSALGLYGLVSYIVGLSRQEIAIRLALGASHYRIVSLIVRNGLVLVLAGILIGSAGAFAAGRALQAQLFQTGAADPSAFAGVCTMLLAVTVVATLLPARRAARINPQTALRGD